jgi:hypothetical protein
VKALPEVRVVEVQLAALADETLDLVERLESVSSLAVQLLPSCVGVSITVVVDGDPFTVTATTADINLLDATQYLDGGPCLDATAAEDEVRVVDVLDERQWQAFAQAAAATGVRSSLSIPLHRPSGEAFGALNLYASELDAFRGKEGQLADLFGVHVNELVTNADLSFVTREHARELPQRLADHERVNQAVGLLVERRGWTAKEARERMELAAGSAHASMTSIAEVVMVMID